MTTWRSRLGLVLALGLLPAGTGLVRSSVVHAQQGSRLQTFINWGDQLAYRWSDDSGFSWSAWGVHQNLLFNGSPAAAADRAGRVLVLVRHGGDLLYDTFLSNPRSWSRPFFAVLAGGGGRRIGGR